MLNYLLACNKLPSLFVIMTKKVVIKYKLSRYNVLRWSIVLTYCFRLQRYKLFVYVVPFKLDF